MKRSDQINEISKALAAAKLEMKSAVKDSVNEFHKSKYADYDSLLEAVTAALSNHGLVALQELISKENYLEVVTFISHESGQYFEFEPFSIPITKRDPQSYGSLSTYALKYSLRAALGIRVGGDDDAETCMDRITDSHIKHINSLIQETGEPALRSIILSKYSLKDFKEMTGSQYQIIVNTLKTKIHAKTKTHSSSNPAGTRDMPGDAEKNEETLSLV